eukprot:TRINITY_DN19498_c0_g2_i1.p1 TRINITY_DN19498_c0_g2~~TRINITY_DN19498_c0_g2_i1.p1  ORF type:complete len:654 (+),score=144.40 TRINITY_DN19498_c0_g2_i1:71-2032(+)
MVTSSRSSAISPRIPVASVSPPAPWPTSQSMVSMRVAQFQQGGFGGESMPLLSPAIAEPVAAKDSGQFSWGAHSPSRPTSAASPQASLHVQVGPWHQTPRRFRQSVNQAQHLVAPSPSFPEPEGFAFGGSMSSSAQARARSPSNSNSKAKMMVRHTSHSPVRERVAQVGVGPGGVTRLTVGSPNHYSYTPLTARGATAKEPTSALSNSAGVQRAYASPAVPRSSHRADAGSEDPTGSAARRIAVADSHARDSGPHAAAEVSSILSWMQRLQQHLDSSVSSLSDTWRGVSDDLQQLAAHVNKVEEDLAETQLKLEKQASSGSSSPNRKEETREGIQQLKASEAALRKLEERLGQLEVPAPRAAAQPESDPILGGRIALLESQMTEARSRRPEEEKLGARLEALERQFSELKASTDKRLDGHESLRRQDNAASSTKQLSSSGLSLDDVADLARAAQSDAAEALRDSRQVAEKLGAQEAMAANIQKLASSLERYDVSYVQLSARLAEQDREMHRALRRLSGEARELNEDTRSRFDQLSARILEADCMCRDHSDRLGSLELMCLQLETARATLAENTPDDEEENSPGDLLEKDDVAVTEQLRKARFQRREDEEVEGGRNKGAAGYIRAAHSLRQELITCLRDGRLEDAVRQLEAAAQ